VPENEAFRVKIQVVNALDCICIEFWDVPKWPKLSKTRIYYKKESKNQKWNRGFWSRKRE